MAVNTTWLVCPAAGYVSLSPVLKIVKVGFAGLKLPIMPVK